MKISLKTNAVTVGMFIDSMDGPWLSHPFWKSRFVISSAKQLRKLRDSGVTSVVIDDSFGVGPASETKEQVASEMPDASLRASRIPPVRAAISAMQFGSDVELRRATDTVRRSKHEVMRMFSQARLGHAIQPAALAPLVDEICDSVERDVTALLKVTRLKKANEYTYLHSVAVSALMIALAGQLKLDPALTRELGLAGMLHDIGKMAIPPEILDKPGRLTDEEMQIIRGHPEKGHAMFDEDDLSPIVRDVIRHHHEKMDGTGYPDGLSGDRLSLYARMAAVCDVYDAVTSDRAYKTAWTPCDALSRMLEWTGHFDPDILNVFMLSIGIYPVGQLVRLRSNRLALVVAENRKEPTLPTVRAFYATTEHAFIPLEDVRISTSLKGDCVVGVEHGGLRFADWDRIAEAVRNRAWTANGPRNPTATAEAAR